MGKAKLNIPMCAALVLLFLTMLSIHLTSGLYARYTATSTASDSARVAKFDVKGTGSGDLTVTSANTEAGIYTLTIENDSEVAVEYDIGVTFNEAIDSSMLVVTLNDASGTLSADRKTIVFAGKENLAPNADPVTKTLKFQILDWAFVTGKTNIDLGTTINKALTFTVNINAVQVD